VNGHLADTEKLCTDSFNFSIILTHIITWIVIDAVVVADVNEKLMTTMLYVSILTTIVMTGVAIGLIKRYSI